MARDGMEHRLRFLVALLFATYEDHEVIATSESILFNDVAHHERCIERVALVHARDRIELTRKRRRGRTQIDEQRAFFGILQKPF